MFLQLFSYLCLKCYSESNPSQLKKFVERFICKLEGNTTKLNMLIKLNKQNCFLLFLKEYLIYNLFVTAVKGINNVYATRVQNPCFHYFEKLSGTVHTFISK